MLICLKNINSGSLTCVSVYSPKLSSSLGIESSEFKLLMHGIDKNVAFRNFWKGQIQKIIQFTKRIFNYVFL